MFLSIESIIRTGAFPFQPIRNFFSSIDRSTFIRKQMVSEEEVNEEICELDEVTLNSSQDQVKKGRSWVYNYAQKIEKGNKAYFHCRFEYRSGERCTYKVQTKQGQTSNISTHLKEKHGLKPPSKQIQTSMVQFVGKQQKEKTFRESYAKLVPTKYLPFSLIEEQVLQDAFLSFYKEYTTTRKQPKFVTGKTVCSDITKLAEDYVEIMSERFSSKLSLCMDVWTGPNRMSFLGITFTYLDDDFVIQRGLLDLVKMKKKHTGEYIAKLFQRVMDLYRIDKDMIGGITQDNASNCGTCIDALVGMGYDRHIFHGCFLHVLNLACQAAIDPFRKTKTKRIRLTSDLEDFPVQKIVTTKRIRITKRISMQTN